MPNNSKYKMVKLKHLSYYTLKEDLMLYTGNVMTAHFSPPCDCDKFLSYIPRKGAVFSEKYF